MIPIKVFKICPNTDQVLGEYASIQEAASTMGVDESTIRKTLDAPTRTCKNYKWRTTKLRTDVASFNGPKILILDIETAPMEAYIWRLWKQLIIPYQLISDWYILTWAAKWLYEDEVYSGALSSEEAKAEDDSRIMADLWHYLEQADIVVAHNGDKFDIPRIKTRLLLHDISPPSFYKQLDTLKVVKKEFDFSSNSLDDLAKFLGIPGKFTTNFNLWKAARNGDIKALSDMEEYNIQDVKLLEDVYLALRPWIKGHPNLDLYTDNENPLCPHCASSNVVEVDGKFVYTQAVRYTMYRCLDCGAVARGKKGVKYSNKKQISAIPR